MPHPFYEKWKKKFKTKKLKTLRQWMSDFDQNFDQNFNAQIKFLKQKMLCLRRNKKACDANKHLKYDSSRLELWTDDVEIWYLFWIEILRVFVGV